MTTDLDIAEAFVLLSLLLVSVGQLHTYVNVHLKYLSYYQSSGHSYLFVFFFFVHLPFSI